MSDNIMHGSSDDWNKMNPKFRNRLLSELTRLKAEVDRLTKAGDELHIFLISYIVEGRISSSYLNELDDNWNAAKEGKGQP